MNWLISIPSHSLTNMGKTPPCPIPMPGMAREERKELGTLSSVFTHKPRTTKYTQVFKKMDSCYSIGEDFCNPSTRRVPCSQADASSTSDHSTSSAWKTNIMLRGIKKIANRPQTAWLTGRSSKIVMRLVLYSVSKPFPRVYQFSNSF